MNKIFKVIWSHTTQSWVAVSELTKARGKTKSTAKTAAALVVVGAGMFGGLDAYARYIYQWNEGIVGDETAKQSSRNSVRLGSHNAIGEGSVLVGFGHISADGSKASAIGYNSRAMGDQSVALGL